MSMKRGLVLIAAVAAIVLPGSAAWAHPGHTSCQAAGQFAAATAQALGSGFGEAASSLAQQGLADDFVADIHAGLCAP
jgi:hypothetical protein